jgi:hypothetical protein
MLAFYMDHHVPRAITEGLRRRGIDVITAFDDGRDTDDDEPLLERATQLGRVLVTHDQDFLEIGPRWQRGSRSFSEIAYGIPKRVSIGGMIDYLELIARVMSADDMRDRIEYIPTA